MKYQQSATTTACKFHCSQQQLFWVFGGFLCCYCFLLNKNDTVWQNHRSPVLLLVYGATDGKTSVLKRVSWTVRGLWTWPTRPAATRPVSDPGFSPEPERLWAALITLREFVNTFAFDRLPRRLQKLVKKKKTVKIPVMKSRGVILEGK